MAWYIQGVSKIVPFLRGCCGGAVDSVISLSRQLHRSGFNLDFETLYDSARQVVDDLWQRNGEISGCFKNRTSIVLRQCQNTVRFQRKGFSVVQIFLLNL